MKAIRIPIDSDVLGRSVLSIEDYSSADDFAAFEAGYIAEHDPLYVFCKVPLERIADVHSLESKGFRLIECQIRTRIELRNEFDMSAVPYKFARVTTEEELEGVLEIAATTFERDRFSVDPEIDPHASGERYRRYARRSFEVPDEDVYRLYDPESGRTVAFKTHRYLPNDEVLLLLGGVHPDYKNLGVGVINSYAELNELRRRGIKRGITHISAVNFPVFNVEVGKLGFRVITTFAVMRKIYR